MERRHKGEGGQVLVILTIGIVVLLGFTALAVDGGMYYSDRRYDQNTADTAALAGAGAAANVLGSAGVGLAGFECSDADVQAAITAAENAAVANALANNFDIDTDISDGNGVQVTCEDTGGSAGKFLDVEVLIRSETQTSFAHLFFDGALINNVEAISRVEPGVSGPFAAGYAILALRPNCTNKLGGIRVDGTIEIYVQTGKIFSNACIDANGNSGTAESNDGIFYITELDDTHVVFIQPPNKMPQPVTTPVQLSMDPLDSECAAQPLGQAVDCGNKKVCMSHGRYSSYKNTGGDDLILEPGLYCFSGAFESNNGSVTVDSDYSDDEGVTFYLYKTGSFSVLGNSKDKYNELRAAKVTDGISVTNGAVPGLLIQMDEENTNQIVFGGNAGSYFQGTMFAPDGSIDFGGNTDMNGTQAVQVIADTIILHGNPNVTVFYEDDDVYQHAGSPLLDLYK